MRPGRQNTNTFLVDCRRGQLHRQSCVDVLISQLRDVVTRVTAPQKRTLTGTVWDRANPNDARPAHQNTPARLVDGLPRQLHRQTWEDA